MDIRSTTLEAATQREDSTRLAAVFAAESAARALLAQADPAGAATAFRALYAEIVGRYCMAALGDQPLASDTAKEVWAAFEDAISKADLTRTVRSVVLACARRRCAHLLETGAGPTDVATSEEGKQALSGAEATPTVSRRVLARLRPSDRELLILRYVSNLAYAEIGPLWECSESDVRGRLSRALVRAINRTNDSESSGDRDRHRQFDEHLAEIIDRTAPSELLEAVANDDALRDARHETFELVKLLAHAADDYLGHEMPARSAEGSPDQCSGSEVVAHEPQDTATVQIQSQSAPLTAPSKADASAETDTLEQPDQPQRTPLNTTSEPNAATEPAGHDSSKSNQRNTGRPGGGADRRNAAVWVALSLVAVLAVAVLLLKSGAKPEWQSNAPGGPLRGTLTKVEGFSEASRVEICAADGGGCRIAQPGARVDSGALVRTNSRARARIELDSRANLSLDRATAVVLAVRGGSHLVLNAGTAVVDADQDDARAIVVEFARGHAELERAKCAITVEETQTLIELTRGRARLVDKSGHERVLGPGETGRLTAGHDISASYSRSVGDAVSSSESVADDRLDEGEALRGLGELRAKKPGDTSERDNAVRLARHQVKVHIVGAIAKTEIDETFANDSNEVLEGIFRFPLPADAQIERLALEVDGSLVEGAFTDRERASAIWRGSIVHAAPQLRAQIHDEIIWVPGPWRDPALLEWQRGNRFELRIFPIPKQGSRRVVLSYTQVVPGSAGARRYSYPLPWQRAAPHGIEDFSFELEMRGHEASHSPTVVGYDGKLSKPSSDVASFSLREQQFLPRGDLVVDYELPQGQEELVAWAHQSAISNEQPYVAMLLRPRLPSARAQTPRTYAFVVDTSRSMIGESLRRATALTARMIRELSSDDRVLVLACDSECRRWPDGLVSGGRVAADSAQHWLQAQSAEGASDLAGAIAGAVAALAHGAGTNQQIVYFGDGTPTVGPTRPATIAREVHRHLGTTATSVTAVAIGADSDLESLRAVARAGRGVVVPYVPGTSVSRASYTALAATFGTRLVDAQIEWPSGVVGVAPEHLGTVAAGDELLVVGRLNSAEIRGEVVLRGRVDDHDFEQRYTVDLQAMAGNGNAFVPRLFAAARIADLERRGDAGAKKEAIDLSRRFSVASRFTSLLVLESRAMFDAFGLDNRRTSETWTGELEASATNAAPTAEQYDAETPSDAYSARDGVPAATGTSIRRRAASGAAKSAGDFSSPPTAFAPAPSAVAQDPWSGGAVSAKPKSASAMDEAREAQWTPPPSPARRRLIPMRRIWERRGEIRTGRTQPSTESYDKIAAAEREYAQNPNRREGVKQLFDLYARSGDLAKAGELAESWSQRDPLDVEALVARADLAARRGDRVTAIRILGSVVDVRPGDIGAQQRLGRLYRWQGQPELACRFSLALAEFRPNDDKTLAEALRCLSENNRELSDELRSTVAERVLRAAERMLEQPKGVDRLSGDLRLTATWQASEAVDVDLSLIDPDAHRVSWLGAPTRAVISATNATSQHEEGLALRGSKPGEYLLEVSRGSGAGTVHGTVTVHVAGTQREIPFDLEGDRVILGVIKITTVPRLVPLGPSAAIRIAE